MLAPLKALFGVKNPKYDWKSYVENALFTKRLSTVCTGKYYLYQKMRVELPVYTKEVRSFWTSMLGKGIFRLKGYQNKWAVVQITRGSVMLEEVVFIHQLKQRDS